MRFTKAFLAGLVIASFATAVSADIAPRPRPRPPVPAPDPASLSNPASAKVKITGSAASDIAKLRLWPRGAERGVREDAGRRQLYLHLEPGWQCWSRCALMARSSLMA